MRRAISGPADRESTTQMRREGIALLTMLLCRAGHAVAAGKAAGDGEGDYIATLTEGIFPIGDIRTCTVRTPPGAAQYT